MIGQDDDRALDIEKADDVVVVGDAAAPMHDVAQISAAEREQLFALGGVAVRKDIRDPAEAIANGCAVAMSIMMLAERGETKLRRSPASLFPAVSLLGRGNFHTPFAAPHGGSAALYGVLQLQRRDPRMDPRCH
jgi:hypothetical protein